MPLTVPLSQIRVRLEKLDRAISTATKADGSLSGDALRAEVQKANDPAVTAAMVRLLDERGTSVAPRFDPVETAAMHQALQEAVRNVAHFDVNKDGVVVWNTRAKVEKPLSQRVTEQVIETLKGNAGGAIPHERDDSRLLGVELGGRSYVHKEVEAELTAHVKTPQGKEAVRWAARLKFLDDHEGARALGSHLRSADESWAVRNFPDRKHDLNDKEVRKYLKTSDLVGFAEKTKAAVEAKIGMSWDDYVAGKGLPVTHRLTHEFTAATSGRGS